MMSTFKVNATSYSSSLHSSWTINLTGKATPVLGCLSGISDSICSKLLTFPIKTCFTCRLSNLSSHYHIVSGAQMKNLKSFLTFLLPHTPTSAEAPSEKSNQNLTSPTTSTAITLARAIIISLHLGYSDSLSVYPSHHFSPLATYRSVCLSLPTSSSQPILITVVRLLQIMSLFSTECPPSLGLFRVKANGI